MSSFEEAQSSGCTDVGYGLDPKLAPKIMDPSGAFFDSGPGRAHAMIDGWHKFGEPNGMDLWVGEIAAAWHSGCAAHLRVVCTPPLTACPVAGAGSPA